jgi:hypothetical protein
VINNLKFIDGVLYKLTPISKRLTPISKRLVLVQGQEPKQTGVRITPDGVTPLYARTAQNAANAIDAERNDLCNQVDFWKGVAKDRKVRNDELAAMMHKAREEFKMDRTKLTAAADAWRDLSFTSSNKAAKLRVLLSRCWNALLTRGVPMENPFMLEVKAAAEDHK